MNLRSNKTKLSKITTAMMMAGLMLSPIGSAFAQNVLVETNIKSEGVNWSTYQIDIRNTGGEAIDMHQATVEFVLEQATADINWASGTLSYPNWTVEHTNTSEGVHHKLTFSFPTETWATSSLAQDQDFGVSVALAGMISDLAQFESTIVFNGEAGVEPPLGDISVIAPVAGERLPVGESTTIKVDIDASEGDRIEFWAANAKLGQQNVDGQQTEYEYRWTPSQLGQAEVEVILFSADDQRITSERVQVEITQGDENFFPPEVSFVTPSEGDSFKLTESIAIKVEATDQDDDISRVIVTANNQEVCSFDANDATNNSDVYACDWQPEQAGSVALTATATDEQSLTGSASVNITVTKSSGGECGDIPQYTNGGSYMAGDQVFNGGNIFSCDVFGWCGESAYEPGIEHPAYGDAWRSAWTDLGECDVTPVPDIEMISPANGQRYRLDESIQVEVEASTQEGEITRVEIKLNNEVIETLTEPTNDNRYNVVLSDLVEGVYNLTAEAHNSEGGSSETAATTLAVTDLDLLVGLTSPADGSVFYEGRAIRKSAQAVSFEGEVDKVQFLVNDQQVGEVTDAPFEFQWNGAQVGTHKVTAVAFNSLGQHQTSAVSNIEVKENSSELDLRNNPDRSITYLTSWGLRDIEELQNSQGDGYFLSFGQWDSAGNILISDNMTTPSYNPSWMDPAYLSWTQLKQANPNKAMMIAMGGATYDGMWSHMETQQQRDAIVDNLVDLMFTEYPVYKKNLTEEEMVGECLDKDWSGNCNFASYQLAGYATIDGIDFDFERTGRITEQDNNNLESLVKQLKERIGESKLLSLTTYHTGADPVECLDNTVFEGCSFVENDRSQHHGEIIPLLHATKDTFDFFNVMAYDAGENFLYQVAMENYAEHVGDKTKVVLGNTINSQWGPDGRFVETREQNIERTQWQKDNGFGGFFIWTLGSNTESLTMSEQVDYFNELIRNN
ncbi:Ig-like domain-containing protein [Vibrio sp. FNV 38]|nr:Ig-like domain-containing protein [Vibrio sp. FNV 38]